MVAGSLSLAEAARIVTWRGQGAGGLPWAMVAAHTQARSGPRTLAARRTMMTRAGVAAVRAAEVAWAMSASADSPAPLASWAVAGGAASLLRSTACPTPRTAEAEAEEATGPTYCADHT